MSKKAEILRRLTQAGDFVSGQDLSEILQVSRTAVWKNIQKLKEEGYPIEAVTNKGYRLLSVAEADVLDQSQIADRLTTAWVGRPLLYREETGSTNDDVFKLAAEGYPHGTLVIASRQTAGKGRRGRTWISPQDGNIYMSILLKPDLPPDVTPMLTIVMALSVYQASVDLLTNGTPAPSAPQDPRTLPGSHAGRDGAAAAGAAEPGAAGRAGRGPDGTQPDIRFGIKWPNDIVVSVDGGPYRKLCGILTEMRMEDSEISAITIGTGLNINQMEFAPEIAENATSYALAMGERINRAAFTASIWNRFETNYSLFVQTRDFTRLRPAYEEGLVNRDRAVHVLDPHAPFTGIAIGINARGELLVRPDDGSPVQTIGSGEVSVRGVQGYV